ncbi:type I restriction endonuclease [Spirosoma arcticum]
MMQDGLQNFIDSKKQEGTLAKQGEEATKQGLILPMLQHLGWNPFDVQEVFPEYSIQSGRVDYSLRFNNLNKVFIEVKKVSEDLEKHQEQLLRYAFHHGVKLAILTNGIIWWFYLPLHEGSWEQRRFYTIDIQTQATTDIIEKLSAFLSKQEVIDGKAVKNAENIYNSRQKGELIVQTLPKAWRKLLSESDDSLCEVVAEAVEKICGYKPDYEIVIRFLKDISGETSLKSHPRPPSQKSTESTIPAQQPVAYESDLNGREHTVKDSIETDKPTSFEFNSQLYEVNSWISLLKTFVGVIAEKHPHELNKLTLIAGKQRPYFTTNSSLLRKASNIPNSPIFYETHFSANGIIRLIGKVLTAMNYTDNSIKINTTAGHN